MTTAGPERPGLAQLLSGARVFRVGLRGSFRGLTERQGILLPGPCGWGEFAPFPDYSAERAGRWLAAAVEAAYVGWPAPYRDSIEVNGILPVRGLPETRRLAERIVRELGCRTIKVKVADPQESAESEHRRIALVRDVLAQELGSAHGNIRLDANGGWGARQALERLDGLAPLGIEYVEQPCRSVAELSEVHAADLVPIAADEAIRIDGEVETVADFADVAVVKAAPLGGVAVTMAVAERVGVPVVVSGSMDTSVGLSAAIALAGALPDLPYACGLGTGLLLADDLTETTTRPVAGSIAVARRDPDPERLALAEARVSDSDRAAWRARLTDAWRYVPEALADRVAAQ